MEIDYDGFSIREYTKNVRSVEVRKCWPFSGDITGERILSLLPPITVVKFRWWSHELASLLAKSPVAADDSDPVFRRKATTSKAKYTKPCKKRSIVEIFAAAPQIQLAHREADDGNDSDVLFSSKRKRMKNLVLQKKIKSNKSKDSGDRKFANKVNKKCREQDRDKVDDGKFSLGIEESSGGVMSLSRKKAESFSKDEDSEYQIPGILRAKRKVCTVRTPDKLNTYDSQWERHVRFSGDQSEKLSQLKISIASLELLCFEMNRLTLFSVNDQKTTKVISNDMQLQFESRQKNKFQPAVSERRLSNAPREKSGLSCSQGHVAQPNRSYSSTSQHVSADTHWGTSLYQSPFNPFLTGWMQKSVLSRQNHVEETISGYPLNLQGELVEANGEESRRSFDRSGLSTSCSSRYASEENDRNVTDFSAKDGVGKFEKRRNYFPARLGIDETFTENNNDGEFSHQTVHSPVASLNPRNHTINLSKQHGLNQNLDIRNNMFANSCWTWISPS